MRADPKAPSGEEECSICYEHSACLCTLGCTHRFCKRCLAAQLHHDARCALCRAPMYACSPELYQPDPTATRRIVLRGERKDERRRRRRQAKTTAKSTVGSSDALPPPIGMSVLHRDDATAIVAHVVPGGRADVYGLRIGDEIVCVNGFPTTRTSARALRQLLTCYDRTLCVHVRRPAPQGRRLASRVWACLVPALSRSVFALRDHSAPRHASPSRHVISLERVRRQRSARSDDVEADDDEDTLMFTV